MKGHLDRQRGGGVLKKYDEPVSPHEGRVLDIL